MQIGCHASVWTGTFDDAGLRLAIDKTAEAGFDLIEIPLMDPDKADATAVKRVLNAAGLGVTASLGTLQEDRRLQRGPRDRGSRRSVSAPLPGISRRRGGTHLVGVIYCAMRKYMAAATKTNRQHSIVVMGRLEQGIHPPLKPSGRPVDSIRRGFGPARSARRHPRRRIATGIRAHDFTSALPLPPASTAIPRTAPRHHGPDHPRLPTRTKSMER
jgi:hypothetical protein